MWSCARVAANSEMTLYCGQSSILHGVCMAWQGCTLLRCPCGRTAPQTDMRVEAAHLFRAYADFSRVAEQVRCGRAGRQARLLRGCDRVLRTPMLAPAGTTCLPD